MMLLQKYLMHTKVRASLLPNLLGAVMFRQALLWRLVFFVHACYCFHPDPPHGWMKRRRNHHDIMEDSRSSECRTRLCLSVTKDSLSDSVSSPERYASALGLTVDQVQHVIQQRQQSVYDLQQRMENEMDGTKRHRILCQHRLEHGKHPFVCKKCWSYQPICICSDVMHVPPKKIPCQRVILWTHHSEWGSPSNTGSVLPLVLENTQMLMKGWHDQELARILLEDSKVQPIVLWPHDVGPHPRKRLDLHEPQIQKITLDELNEAENVILLAMEGTWRQARRMIGKLPYPRLAIETDHSPSLLVPLRAQGKKPKPDHCVCTAQAVLLALQGMGMEPDSFVLDLVRRKVEQTRRYQGKPESRR